MRAGQKPDYAGSREPAPVVKETRQAHSVRFLLNAAGYSAAATLVSCFWPRAREVCGPAKPKYPQPARKP